MRQSETGYTCAVGTGRQSEGGLQWGGVHIRIVVNDRNGSHSAEGFFGSLKRERVNRRHYRSIAEARSDVFHYIERFHNPGMQQRLDAEDQKFLALTQLATKTELNPTPGGLIMNSNESHIPLGWPPVIPRLSVANPSMCVNFLREVFGAQGTFNTDMT